MKTILTRLQSLPEPYRSQAIENAMPKWLYKKVYSVNIALGFAFEWETSPQGFDYWKALQESL